MDTPGASAGVCYGCYHDLQVPPWYAKAEDYTLTAAFRKGGEALPVARRRPRTGVPMLDLPTPPRIIDVLGGLAPSDPSPRGRRLRAYLEHLAIREALAGLGDGLECSMTQEWQPG